MLYRIQQLYFEEGYIQRYDKGWNRAFSFNPYGFISLSSSERINDSEETFWRAIHYWSVDKIKKAILN